MMPSCIHEIHDALFDNASLTPACADAIVYTQLDTGHLSGSNPEPSLRQQDQPSRSTPAPAPASTTPSLRSTPTVAAAPSTASECRLPIVRPSSTPALSMPTNSTNSQQADAATSSGLHFRTLLEVPYVSKPRAVKKPSRPLSEVMPSRPLSRPPRAALSPTTSSPVACSLGAEGAQAPKGPSSSSTRFTASPHLVSSS